jgi:hypothetical protein
VFDFVGRHVLSFGTWNNRDATQFLEVVRYLAEPGLHSKATAISSCPLPGQKGS